MTTQHHALPLQYKNVKHHHLFEFLPSKHTNRKYQQKGEWRLDKHYAITPSIITKTNCLVNNKHIYQAQNEQVVWVVQLLQNHLST